MHGFPQTHRFRVTKLKIMKPGAKPLRVLTHTCACERFPGLEHWWGGSCAQCVAEGQWSAAAADGNVVPFSAPVCRNTKKNATIIAATSSSIP